MHFFLLYACTDQNSKNKQVIVFCASSLSPVIEQMKQQWKKDHDETIITSAASSGTLARQIENGAKADLFLAANDEWMTYLIQKMQEKIQPRKIASNRLVVVVPSGSQNDCKDIDELFALISNQKFQLAIGDPGHVPLGKYTKEVIENHYSFHELSKNLILTKDARSALRLVELGEVEFGIVYQSDARSSTRTRIVFSIPENTHSRINYQAALINQNNAAAIKFLDYISSADNKAIWTKNGFAD